MRKFLIAMVMTLELGVPSALASQPVSPQSVEAQVAALKAGEYLWMPQLAPAGPMLIIVNLRTQRLVAYRNGVPIGISTVSTGKPGYATPTGVYSILQKRVEYYSRKYDWAPMPHMQRLTWAGVAMHGGTLPGYPASHGCIRLPRAFAAKLYKETRIGMTVIVTDQRELPRLAPDAGPTFVQANTGSNGDWWDPSRSPSGPVTVIVSGKDGRLEVLRNGTIIAEGNIGMDPPIPHLLAYTFASHADGKRRWVRIAMDPTSGLHDDTSYAPTVTVSSLLKDAIEQLLQPGDTVILVPDSLKAPDGEAQCDASVQSDECPGPSDIGGANQTTPPVKSPTVPN